MRTCCIAQGTPLLSTVETNTIPQFKKKKKRKKQ